jgi:hypothetical protein
MQNKNIDQGGGGCKMTQENEGTDRLPFLADMKKQPYYKPTLRIFLYPE